MNEIYLDNNATTPVLPAVWEAMRPFLSQTYGNPASAHWAGRRARHALEDARERTAHLLGAFPDEVVFTSGATEANNLAILGLAGATGGELITSPIEHPSVTEPVQQLGQSGWIVKRLLVCSAGLIQADALPGLVTPETRLVCVMLVNNETGALQPIAALARLLEGRATFHCDAAQAVGKVRVQFHDLGVTTLSLSAHKFHGPKGIGVLLVRRGTRLPARSWGGHQQAGLRPGTEPVALAVGLAAALDLAQRSQDTHYAYVSRLRDLFLSRLSDEAGPLVVNGPPQERVPHTLNLSFPGCRADALLMNLDLAGVACSTGSACSSGSLLPSPVLQAMGVPPEVLGSSMRFSFSPLLSEEEILEAAQRVAATVRRLRSTGEE
ncbi:MAG TPA: cysteine desulfurase family protein [Gemmataceae bacterium]|nr:cysteine desulfurase family protein [Gemmataceae bacterium]